MDITDGTRIKSCYDNFINREYYIESMSVWYFTQELVVSEIERVCGSERLRLLLQTECENTVRTDLQWCIMFIVYILSFNIFPMTINC